MDHQDLKVVNIGNGKKSQPVKKIVPKNHVDTHKIKIENEQENFSIQTIPRKLSQQITQCRVNNKLTQKEMATKLCVQPAIYNGLENGKAKYDPSTKQLIQKIQKTFGVKFEK